MVDKTPFGARAYPKVCFGHFMFALVLGVLFACGMEYSGKERGENKTPYFFPACVLAGFHVVCVFCSLYVAVSTRNKDVFDRKNSVNNVLAWYNFILLLGELWSFIGLVITSVLGCCRGQRCYVQQQETVNILIAVAILVLHAVCLIWFMYLSTRVRVIERLPSLSKQPLSSKHRVEIKIKKIILESDNESSDEEKKSKLKLTPKEQDNKALDGPVADAGKFPFAVLAKSVAKFMHARSKNKVTPPQQQGVVGENKPAKQPKRLLRRHMSTPVGQSRAHVSPPPPYESVVGRKQKQKEVEVEVEANPYHLPPLPEHQRPTHAPDNLYSGASFPDTDIVVIHPKR